MNKKEYIPQWIQDSYNNFMEKHIRGKETYELFYSSDLYMEFVDNNTCLEPVYQTNDVYGNKELHFVEDPTWP